MPNLATQNINSSPVLKRYCTSSTASPFGSSLPNRAWSDVSRVYRYGFNGKEKDFETANDGYDFGARIYDGRLGRWLSLDPLMKEYVEFSGYNFGLNNSILNFDPDGKDVWVAVNATTPEYSGHAKIIVTNYVKQTRMINGVQKDIYIKSGYNTYDLVPQKIVNGQTVGGYSKVTLTKGNPDFSTYSAEGVFNVNEIKAVPNKIGENFEYFTADQIQKDLDINSKAESIKIKNNSYSILNNNCTDYVVQSLSGTLAINAKENVVDPFTKLIPFTLSTPNVLAQKLSSTTGVKIVKYDKDKFSVKTQDYINNLSVADWQAYLND